MTQMTQPTSTSHIQRAAVAVLVLLAAATLLSQNRIDTISPAAPELALFGPYPIGVRTIQAVDRDRPDILNTKEGSPTARYDRTLTLEVWYPAALAEGQQPGGEYRTVARTPTIATTIRGRAVRDAAPREPGPDGAYPLVIISHGYPGNRYLMSHLGENLATKGFVTVSIDHTDSTYDDQKAFASTLYNRPFDQLFVLREMSRLAAPGSGSFLAGVVDTNRAGIVGYSMGGYGVVNVVGGGFSDTSVAGTQAPPNRLLYDRAASNPAYRQAGDSRIKAAIAIAPWGMPAGYWDADGLAGIRTPVMFVAGSVDEVAGYAKGARAIYDGAVHAERALLTFINAAHNAAAPYPAPAEAYTDPARPGTSPFSHYADAVWDTTRMNNILQHFATAWFDLYLKGDAGRQAYLDVVPAGKDAVWATDRDGNVEATHTYWKGFKRGTAVGLMLERAKPQGGQPPPDARK